MKYLDSISEYYKLVCATFWKACSTNSTQCWMKKKRAKKITFDARIGSAFILEVSKYKMQAEHDKNRKNHSKRKMQIVSKVLLKTTEYNGLIFRTGNEGFCAKLHCYSHLHFSVPISKTPQLFLYKALGCSVYRKWDYSVMQTK